MNSVLALASLIKDKRKFNFIYIDGQHCGHTPLSDMIMSHEILDIGGILAIDDCGYIYTEEFGKFNVKECFDAFYSIYKQYYDILINDYQVWLIRRV